MESLAIGHQDKFKSKRSNGFKKISFSGLEINFGLINYNIPDFDPSKKIHGLLIKKLAFSCNYRDKAMCMLIYISCLQNSTSDRFIHSGFGSEFVGEVIAVGSAIMNFSVGDRVIPNGAYPFFRARTASGIPTNYSSELFSIFDEEQVIKIPRNLNIEVAAALSITGQTVYSMIRRADIKKGKSVLITAASSNTSLFAMESLKSNDVNVVGITNSHEKIEPLLKLGYADVVISPHIDPTPLSNISKRLNGFDVAIDPFSDLYLNHIVNYMNYFSKYFTCGIYRQNSLFEKTELEKSSNLDINFFKKILVKNISIIGNCLGSTEDLAKAITDVSEGNSKIHIDSSYSGDDYGKFIQRTFFDQNRLGKVIYCY